MATRKVSTRYDADGGIEARSEPGSRGNVLANLKGVISTRQMNLLENDALLAANKKYLRLISADTRLTIDLICDMHKYWLGGLYEWAGKYRTVEMSKGGFHWPPAFLVAQNMHAFQGHLDRLTPCQGKSISEAVLAMATVQADLLLIHPFREGNGRLSRWVTDLMAMQAGLPPVNYAFRGRESVKNKQQYLQAVISGYKNDYAPLARLLETRLAADLRRRGLGDRPRTPSK